MAVCSFFLQGRCRYGDKCWNEHPRGGNRGGGGGGGGFNDNYSRPQQSRGGGGGYGNRVWVNPSQQKGSYIQPQSFSSPGGNDWGRGGGGGGGGGGGARRENLKSSEFSFSNQNRFSSLNDAGIFDRRGGAAAAGAGGTAGDEDDDKKLEIIQMDMDAWESSGQWGFSCYSGFKTCLSGFTDLSPEELRLEYYSTRASGDLQGYLSGVNQLVNQWKTRVQELKIMNRTTRAALLAELNGAAPQASSNDFGSTTAPGFGFPSSNFESKGFGAPAQTQVNSFSFAAPHAGFGSPAAPASSAGFGSALPASAQAPSGFGSSSSASTFSFAAPNADKPVASSGFGSASGFSFSSTANTGAGQGAGFGAGAPAAAVGSNAFGQTSGGFGAVTASAGAASAMETSDGLFSPENKLTQDELDQFKAKRFTLGQIPLKPPPAKMLMV
ncbi:nucleoporin NUP42 [Cololabis saira]|uniref:nucleoporin NUP42 n=1 Tax=Cololabis saira TaxID=129043 RepID=UPI002AD359CE|nr:nucleoporin NUP42 [Cololabis saira]